MEYLRWVYARTVLEHASPPFHLVLLTHLEDDLTLLFNGPALVKWTKIKHVSMKYNKTKQNKI